MYSEWALTIDILSPAYDLLRAKISFLDILHTVAETHP